MVVIKNGNIQCRPKITLIEKVLQNRSNKNENAHLPTERDVG